MDATEAADLSLPAFDLNDFCNRWKIDELWIVALPDGLYGEPGAYYFVARYGPDAAWSVFDISKANRELSAIVSRPSFVVSRSAVEADPNWIRRPAVLSGLRRLYPIVT